MAESMPPSPAPFKISVDLGTNPRSQSISHYPLEVEQVVLDISQWLKEHAAADALDKVEGLSESELSALESAVGFKFPEVVEILYLTHNGGVRIGEFVTMPAEAIQKTVDANNAASNWDKRFVPLAKNLDDTLFGLLYIGVPKAAAAAAASTGSSGGAGGGAGAGKAKKSDSKEQDDDAAALDDIACFAEWSVDDGLDEAYKGSTPATYLEKYRDKLCSHHYEYVEDCGLVEVGGIPSPSKHTGGAGAAKATGFAASGAGGGAGAKGK